MKPSKSKNDLLALAGGGSGGHVLPAVAVGEAHGGPVLFLGRKGGLEESMARERNWIFAPVAAGKLRRYFSFRNFIDPVFVLTGFFQSLLHLVRHRPGRLISFGGFVSLPPAWAARLLGIPVFLHEQTVHAGLANRLAAPACRKILLTSERSRPFFPPGKTLTVGYPLRRAFFAPVPERLDLGDGLSPLFAGRGEVILVTGGGNGSRLLNGRVLAWARAGEFGDATVVHLTGKDGWAASAPHGHEKYRPLAFHAGMAELLGLASWVLCRGGAGTLAEVEARGRRAVVIPLQGAQADEQRKNAEDLARRHPVAIVSEAEFASMEGSALLGLVRSLPEAGRVAPQDAALRILRECETG